MRSRATLLLFLLPLAGFSQPLQWTTFTSTTNVRDLAPLNDDLWLATSGGAVRFDFDSQTFDVYTNTSGMAMNDCIAVGSDARGWIWVVLTDGRISRLNPQTGQIRQIDDLKDEVYAVSEILKIGDDVFIGANNGIYRLTYFEILNNYRVQESIRVLGDFPSETAVTAMTEYNGFLYAGTGIGMARADLNAGNLSAPAAWETFQAAGGLPVHEKPKIRASRTVDNLPENEINALYASDASGLLWLATSGYVLTFDGTEFGEPMVRPGVIDFAEAGMNIYIATTDSVFFRDITYNSSWRGGGRVPSNIVGLEIFEPGSSEIIVVGLGDQTGVPGGISIAQDSTYQWSDILSAPGVGSNEIADLGIDNNGNLWVSGGGVRPGIFRYNGQEWKRYFLSDDNPQFYFNFTPRSFAFDNYGGTWAGSDGGGAIWIREDSVITFNEHDPLGFGIDTFRVAGIYSNHAYAIARVTRAESGDIFITNRLSHMNRLLLRVPDEWISRGNHPDPWDWFTPSSTPAQSDMQIHEAIVDRYNRIWMGAAYDPGAVFPSYAFDYNGTPSNAGDDTWFEYIPELYQDDFTCFNGIDDAVLDWDIDQQDYLWIGSSQGTYYSQGGVPFSFSYLHFVCLPDLPVGTAVRAVHVDGQNNKWFGTDGGVAVLDENFNWIHVFRTSDDPDYPSQLPSNSVTAVTSDPNTGDVWIGTSDGLSRLASPYIARGDDFDELWPYPNPYRADGSQRMFIDHQKLGGRFDDFHIFTISGSLVRELSWSEMIDTGWDGRNDDGELVAGGVYLLVASSSNGKAVTGKIAVLGR